MRIQHFLLVMVLMLSYTACKEGSKTKSPSSAAAAKPKRIIQIPSFSEDNAYRFIEDQLAFGFRYPGSEGQRQMVKYLEDKLSSYGAKVYKQDFKVDFLDVKGAPATNVIGSFRPELKQRIMLAAHWDSRYIAEKDPDESKRKKPIMGADDGASAVGVLLEIGRLLQETPIDIGIDMVFFDAEDQGVTNDPTKNDTWCLGSQYWAKTPHINNYKAQYGILLDMVGAKNASFGRENISATNAPQLLNKVWKLAQNMGYSNYFKDYNAGQIVDDHYYVIRDRRIPMIDIINRPIDKTDHGFGAYHHTHDDNIDIIDKNTLRAVGKVVTAVIYNASMGRF